MYIIKTVSRYTGYSCQGTHAFPTKKAAEGCIHRNCKDKVCCQS